MKSIIEFGFYLILYLLLRKVNHIVFDKFIQKANTEQQHDTTIILRGVSDMVLACLCVALISWIGGEYD